MAPRVVDAVLRKRIDRGRPRDLLAVHPDRVKRIWSVVMKRIFRPMIFDRSCRQKYDTIVVSSGRSPVTDLEQDDRDRKPFNTAGVARLRRGVATPWRTYAQIVGVTSRFAAFCQLGVLMRPFLGPFMPLTCFL